MDRAKLSVLIAAGLVLAPAAAFAAHGKPGLWTTTTTMHMEGMPQMPPEALAMMRSHHMPIPGEPMTTQICMTQEQVNADKPPAMTNHDESCSSKVLTMSPGTVETEITCRGQMEGTGHIKMSWRGNEHYEGTYNFKGMMDGQSRGMSSQFSGDFVKADCGAVKLSMPSQRMQ